MGIFQAYKMAIKSIKSNKVRSFLTMLGVIIGVAAVIMAVALAQGSTVSITEQISSLGTELITVRVTPFNTNRDITWEDFQDFADDNSDVFSAMSPLISSQTTVKSGISTNTVDTTINGTTADYEMIKKQGVQEGRYIGDIDIDFRQPIAVIGTYTAAELFGQEEAVGKTIKLQNRLFTVVGVLTELEGGNQGTVDDQIIIPLSTAQRVLRNTRITNYSFLASSADAVDQAIEKLKSYLLEIYGDESMYRVQNAEQMLETLDSVTGTMMTVLGGIAAISLLVGGIGIMNIMLVSVTERTREIGIRKAIGAKRKNILTQFLIEALIITGIGGIAGLLLGCAAIWTLGRLGVVPSVYSPCWMVFSFGISLLVGVIFGMFPANKAASLNPIAALRHE